MEVRIVDAFDVISNLIGLTTYGVFACRDLRLSTEMAVEHSLNGVSGTLIRAASRMVR